MGFTPPYLYVRKVTGGWSLTPPSSTLGDDLIIYPNTSTTNSRIELLGAGNLWLVSGGSTIIGFGGSSTTVLTLAFANPDFSITPLAEKNLFLNPTGAGRVKFGTHTAQADTPVTGYIDILDAAGNARKIAVINP